MVEPELLSYLIGLIYDCAIDPERWPGTVAEICRAIGCASGGILLVDRKDSRHRFAYSWGVPAGAGDRYFFPHSEFLTGFFNRLFSRDMNRDGEPVQLSKYIDAVGDRGRKIFYEWIEPRGAIDIVQTVVMRDKTRLGVFSVDRKHESGLMTERELEVIRLLVPHIRRAVTIADILDVQKIEARTLAVTLDNFTSGVVVVGDRGRILHANNAAQNMLKARRPVTSVEGFLSVRDPQANDELSRAIALAQGDERAIGASGIGVSLRGDDPAVAHVLPLSHGDLRTRLMPQATAAVFITQQEASAEPGVGAIANSFGLTPAEARLIEHLVRGATLADAAESLEISMTTARTHLAHIFAKTGTSRQAELIALVGRLSPPISRPS